MRAVIAASLAVAAGLARHVLVYRTVTEGTAQGTGGRRWHRRIGRRRLGSPLRQLHAVVAPLRRRLGGQLDRHGGTAPHVRVRPDPRAAGPDRPQRPAQRRPQSQGRLQGPHDDGGLPGGAHDHDATVPLRLRRALRRVDGGHRVAPRRGGRPRPPGRADQRRGHRPAGPAELGPVRRHDDDGGARRGGLHVGAHRAHPGRRRHGAALRRLQRAHHRLARGPRLLRARRERPLHRGWGEHRPRRPAAPQHGGGPALGRAPARLLPDPRGLRAAARARVAQRQVVRPGGRPPEVAAVANGGGPIAGTMLLTRGVR